MSSYLNLGNPTVLEASEFGESDVSNAIFTPKFVSLW